MGEWLNVADVFSSGGQSENTDHIGIPLIVQYRHSCIKSKESRYFEGSERRMLKGV